MKIFWLLCSAILLANEALATPPYLHKFAFDWRQGEASACLRVNPTLNRKLLRFQCEPNDKNFGGSDKPAETRCRSKSGKIEYLLFSTMADCKLARETSLHNGT